MFCDYFFTQFCTGRTYVKQTLDRAKNLNDSTEKYTRQFFTCIAKLLGTQWFVKSKKKLKSWEVLLRQLFTVD